MAQISLYQRRGCREKPAKLKVEMLERINTVFARVKFVNDESAPPDQSELFDWVLVIQHLLLDDLIHFSVRVLSYRPAALALGQFLVDVLASVCLRNIGSLCPRPANVTYCVVLVFDQDPDAKDRKAQAKGTRKRCILEFGLLLAKEGEPQHGRLMDEVDKVVQKQVTVIIAAKERSCSDDPLAHAFSIEQNSIYLEVLDRWYLANARPFGHSDLAHMTVARVHPFVAYLSEFLARAFTKDRNLVKHDLHGPHHGRENVLFLERA